MRMIFPFLFFGYVLAEIAGFVIVGGAIGVLPTLGLVLLSTLVGIVLMRVQGFGVLNRIRTETAAGHVPGRELVHGVMILLAGFLLLLPGFLTDIFGLLLFIPPVREAVWQRLRNKVHVIRTPGPFRRTSPGTVDLSSSDYRRTDDPDRLPDRN